MGWTVEAIDLGRSYFCGRKQVETEVAAIEQATAWIKQYVKARPDVVKRESSEHRTIYEIITGAFICAGWITITRR